MMRHLHVRQTNSLGVRIAIFPSGVLVECGIQTDLRNIEIEEEDLLKCFL